MTERTDPFFNRFAMGRHVVSDLASPKSSEGSNAVKQGKKNRIQATGVRAAAVVYDADAIGGGAVSHKANHSASYNAFFTGALSRLRGERRYRVFADLERIAGCFPHAIWHSPEGPRNVVIWCSNDYLGMGQHPNVIGAMVETAARMGTGASGTRNIAGNNHPLVELERELADLHGKDAALVFTSGYVSNETGIATIARLIPNCLILSDALESQFDDRRRAAVALRETDLSPQRHGAARRVACRRATQPAETDRVREPLFHGWRYRAR